MRCIERDEKHRNQNKQKHSPSLIKYFSGEARNQPDTEQRKISEQNLNKYHHEALRSCKLKFRALHNVILSWDVMPHFSVLFWWVNVLMAVFYTRSGVRVNLRPFAINRDWIKFTLFHRIDMLFIKYVTLVIDNLLQLEHKNQLQLRLSLP